ncbi:MAG: DUF99 family protein [Candidatus Bathyarchaeia archaeon]
MEIRRLRAIKSEIRVLGISDGGPPFPATTGIGIVGVVFRGGRWFDGVLKTVVSKSRRDEMLLITRMVRLSPHYDQIRVLILDGLLFRGPVLLNIENLRRRLQRPVIAVFDSKKTRVPKGIGAKPVNDENKRQFPFSLWISGIHPEDALALARVITTKSPLPEPLRVSRLVAREFNRRLQFLSKTLKDTRRANRTAT